MFGSDWCLCERELVCGLVQTGVYVRECWWVWFRLVLCERVRGFGSDWCLCERVLVWCLVQTGVYVRECWWVWFRLVFM